MKKRLLLLSMVGAMTLVGCDVSKIENSKGDQVIVKLGNGTEYTANELFDQYATTTSGASEYFNAVYNVLVRNVQPLTNTIQANVANSMDKFIDSAKSTASTNGTSYKTELSKALEAKGVEELDELEQLYYLDEQKKAYEEAYYDEVLNDSLLEEYVKYYAPYHIRHILVKNAADSSLYKGAITEDDAKNLSDTVKRLASGKESFGIVAQTTANNGDSGSAAIYGDVGIMDTTTGFVNEFKFSVYQYDALLNDNAKENVAKFDENQASRSINDTKIPGSPLLPVTAEQKESLVEDINRIPFDVFNKLSDFANYETGEDGEQIKDGKTEYYPRNYLYNQYLNNHNLGCIVKGEAGPDSDRWQTVEGLSASSNEADKVLCDEEGRPILVTKSGTGSGESGYQGIHLIIVQKSAFEADSYDSLVSELKSYYDNTVYATSDDVQDKDSYVTFIKADHQSYKERSNKIKDLVKGFDSFMSYRIYEKALNESKATINDNINTIINNYINVNRQSNAYTAKENYENSWKTYMNLLKVQDATQALKIDEATVEKEFKLSEGALSVK